MGYIKLKVFSLCSQLKKFFLILILIFINPLRQLSLAESDFTEQQKKDISSLESRFFGLTYPADKPSSRISRIEELVFGHNNSQSTLPERLVKLNKATKVAQSSAPLPELPPDDEIANQQKEQISPKNNNQIAKAPNNTQNKQIISLNNLDDLSQEMLQIINQERSLRSLPNLNTDQIAYRTAYQQANYLIQTRQFSHYSLQNKNPDQRYTEQSGDGRIEELVEGFFASVNDKGIVIPIEINREIPHQLMDAILKVPDKADIIFNSLANGIGISFILAPDKSQLVVVAEISVDYGDLAILPPKASISEDIGVSGSLSRGYKFAWVGISKSDLDEEEKSETEASAYFAPIDQVIYLNKSGDRAKNIAKAGGAILAMVAAPFTYGASVLIANVLMQSIAQTYQSQDVEVRDGAKADMGGGNFNSSITLGEWGKGIYYITVWAIPPSEKKPVIISRRAVKVI